MSNKFTFFYGNNHLLETKLLKNEKHQIRVSLLLELVNDAYLTANRTCYMWSSTQETTPLDHTSQTTTQSQAAGNVASSIRSEICITDEL